MSSKKNEIFLATRVNEKLMEQIDSYCIDYKITKSELLRNAVLYFLKFSQQDDKTYHPMMILSKQELAYMFVHLNEEELKEYATLSFDMGQKTIEHYGEIFADGLGLEFEIKPRLIMRAMKNEVFSHYGQNWFQKLEYSFKSNKLLIAGEHNLNVQFSRFFKYLMLKYLSPHNYKIQSENLGEKKVVLNFSKE